MGSRWEGAAEGATEGNRKTQTQTGAERVGRGPSLDRDGKPGVGGSRRTLRNVLSESH